jgi:hypothetical protein
MATATEAVCTECSRPYFPEPSGDPGTCCICTRDARMAASLGPDWRQQIARRPRSSDVFSADLFGREPDASNPRRLPGSTAYNPLGARTTKHGDPL